VYKAKTVYHRPSVWTECMTLNLQFLTDCAAWAHCEPVVFEMQAHRPEPMHANAHSGRAAYH
jgi:hypothetical protein